MTDQKLVSTLTRRDFLAASAVGALGLSCMPQHTATPDASPDEQLLYVGTYTPEGRREGIFLVAFDARSGALRQVGATDAGENPSFLAIHPNGRVLYAVNETTQRAGRPSGGVSAFAIARDTGALTRLGEQASEGGAPCYLSTDRGGRALLVANYVGGNVAVLPVTDDGGLAAAAHVDQHRGATGPNAKRQEAPHAHSILPDPSGEYALSADLGLDRVLVYRFDAAGRRLVPRPEGDAVLHPGAGPRHLAFHPRLPLVYVANELDNTVSTLRWRDGALSVDETVPPQPMLPAGWSGASQAADIHVDPAGRTLYVSNRGHDSIAVFAIARDTGALSFVEAVSTEGHWPRNFTLEPSGRWLLVANERSDSIVVLARDASSGRLTSTGQRLTVPKPVCLRMRAHAGTTT